MVAAPPPPIFSSFLIWLIKSMFINPGNDISNFVFINVISPPIILWLLLSFMIILEEEKKNEVNH